MIKPTMGYNAVPIPSTFDACSVSSENFLYQNCLWFHIPPFYNWEVRHQASDNCSLISDIVECHSCSAVCSSTVTKHMITEKIYKGIVCCSHVCFTFIKFQGFNKWAREVMVPKPHKGLKIKWHRQTHSMTVLKFTRIIPTNYILNATPPPPNTIC
jgi:hypothetical protein